MPTLSGNIATTPVPLGYLRQAVWPTSPRVERKRRRGLAYIKMSDLVTPGHRWNPSSTKSKHVQGWAPGSEWAHWSWLADGKK